MTPTTGIRIRCIRLLLHIAAPSALLLTACEGQTGSSEDNDGPAADTAQSSDTDGVTDNDTGSERNPDTWVEETVDPTELPDDVPTVEIVISAEGQAALEAAPFYGDDVPGGFVNGDGRQYGDVNISYRGAYQLMNLINGDPHGRRNWKVKFPKDDMYQGRREWNFNFEPHLRQKLAYDLMKFAGVKVPNARHVVLLVNGEPQGLYLQYADPDSKDWLFDQFGDESGDLYKAATDMPASEGEPEMKYFADTTYLGDSDADYRYHYRKMTNHKDPAIADDVSVLRDFLDNVNHLSDDELPGWIDTSLDVDRFLSYLVVSNFISNWDSFPQRPKNFWLFENRRTDQMVFIPWDMDNTFQTWESDFNQMGTDTPILYCLRSMEYRPIHSEEGTDRPLAFRLMNQTSIEQAYLARYRELSDTILSADYLNDRIDALNALIAPQLTDAITGEGWTGQTTERSDFEGALDDVRDYVDARTRSIEGQLSK